MEDLSAHLWATYVFIYHALPTHSELPKWSPTGLRGQPGLWRGVGREGKAGPHLELWWLQQQGQYSSRAPPAVAGAFVSMQPLLQG